MLHPTQMFHHHNKSPNGNLWRALTAELVGVALFQLLAGTTVNTPVFTGLTFAAIAYGVRYISGGHLNPAVSLAAAMSGHIDWGRGVFYPIAQILGALMGALLQVGLVPDAKLGEHDPGACVAPLQELSRPQLWSWELFLTFAFLIVVYAAIFVRPGHGDVAPLTYGLALFAAVATGGYFTGGSPLNPAVTIASAIVFRCWKFSWIYLLGQIFAVPLAALWAVTLFGWGTHYPWAHEGLRETLLPGAGEEGTSAGGMAGMGGRMGDSRADTFAPVGHHCPMGRHGGTTASPAGPHVGSMM